MIDGIDVSYAQTQHNIDWEKLTHTTMNPKDPWGDPCRFIYIQSSKYSNVADGTFYKTSDRAYKVGLKRGAYHFCSQNHDAKVTTDPQQQMEFFFKSCGGLGRNPGELPPMLDWEYSKTIAQAGEEGRKARKWNVQWLMKAALTAKELWYPRQNSHRRPIVYTYPWFAIEHKDYLQDCGIEEVADLCFASYKSGPITAANKWGLLPWYPTDSQLPIHKIPAPWNRSHLKLVQYSGDFGLPVPGIPGYTDRQMFLGSQGEFHDFCGEERPPHLIERDVK